MNNVNVGTARQSIGGAMVRKMIEAFESGQMPQSTSPVQEVKLPIENYTAQILALGGEITISSQGTYRSVVEGIVTTGRLEREFGCWYAIITK